MSKGSNRRPGTGYSAGYDGIDWWRKEEPRLPFTPEGLPGQTLTVGPNGQRLWVTLTPKTCQHCKHWLFFSGVRQCMNDDVVALLPESAIGLFSSADFGCNRFEGKV